MNRRNTLILKKAQYVQTVTNVEGFRQANSNSKRNARSLNYSLSHHFSQHIPLFKSHSPSMLRERFLCCDNSRTRELLWHCENSERGEFCEFELTQHASLISWHKMSIAMWQLNATRPSSQSSKKRDTTSLDQFAQRLQERGYRRCARNLQKETCLHFLPTFANAAPNSVFWAAIPPHISQLWRRVTVQPKGILLSHHVETDQGTCFHCFGWDAGPEFYQL